MQVKEKQLTPEQEKLMQSLIDDGYHKLIAKVLALRNYQTQEKLLHYSLLHDMDKAVDCVLEAIITERKICVVADYDVDGATSCAIMVKGLRGLGASVEYFVPNRFKHGYGLQPSVIDDMLLSYPDTDMIVTVDNGISSIAGVQYAKEKNIYVLVTDHHLEGDERPDTIIVNPNRKDCSFPSKALAGCGVAFYLIHAVKDRMTAMCQQGKQQDDIQKGAQYDNRELADYLAIGTIADVVPLDTNNRMLIEYGLKRIRAGGASVGVNAILKVLKIKPESLTTQHIAFRIAPMLNAAGRMEDMSLGINLLLCEQPEQAEIMVENLIVINTERKNTEAAMKEEALHQLSDVKDTGSQFSCVVFGEDFHEGVIGILASRIKDLKYLPTIVFSEMESDSNEILLKGSGRSIEGLHLRDAIDYVFKKSPETVVKFGGHAMAAGLTIKKSHLAKFSELLDEYCASMFQNVKPTHVFEYDIEVDWDDISVELVNDINMMVWGQHFREPLFYGKFKINKQDVLKDAHLKLYLQAPNGMEIEGMRFFYNKPYVGDEIEAVFKLSVNRFFNKVNVQMLIEDAAEIVNT